MSAEGVKKFIAAVDLIFPAPQFDGDRVRQTAWVAVLSSTIGGCADEVLTEAASIILRERNPKKDGRFFPTPQECTDACAMAAKRLEQARTPLLSTDNKDPSPFAGWRRDLADDLMKTSMGAQAIHEGWNLSLYEFARNHGRLPVGPEIGRCREDADYVDRAARGEEALPRQFVELAQNMQARRSELAARFKKEKAA